ncbi:hypothetical protein LCGC14_2830710, partial [marine sediment metagenome]
MQQRREDQTRSDELMAEETPGLEIRIEKAPPGAKAFVPEGDKKVVEFELEPIVEEKDEFVPYVSPFVPWQPVDPQMPGRKSLIMDIETTGVLPWESRIICISLVDPADPDLEVITIYDEEEEKTVRIFIEVLQQNGIEELIGYNLLFDYRFIFAKCLRYRIAAEALGEQDLWDIMEVMEKGRRGFVYGRSKSGSLEDWTKFLFGESKLMTIKEMLKAWGEGRVDDIIAYNRDDVRKTYKLWALTQLVLQPISPTQETTSHAAEAIQPAAPAPMAQPETLGDVPTGQPSEIPGYRRVVSRHSMAE